MKRKQSIKTKEEIMKENVNKTFLGLSGTVWCVIAGLLYGLTNILTKLAFERGIEVAKVTFTRSFFQLLMSYSFGKLVLGISFDLSEYDPRLIKMLFGRGFLGLLSKMSQFYSIENIPLSLSSTISFTTGPILAAFLAFALLGELLSKGESIGVGVGIVGTTMLTMPQWFTFLGIQSSQIEARLEGDMGKYHHYFMGISLALVSSAIDIVSYYLIRKEGPNIPTQLIPYTTGLLSVFLMLPYFTTFHPVDLCYFLRDFSTDSSLTSEQVRALEIERADYFIGSVYLVMGCIMAWMAFEVMIRGVLISKSAIASYAEQIGVVVPFAYDTLVCSR
jgi:drug/metabolite transporter (DMT)-like permease